MFLHQNLTFYCSFLFFAVNLLHQALNHNFLHILETQISN